MTARGKDQTSTNIKPCTTGAVHTRQNPEFRNLLAALLPFALQSRFV